MMRSRAGSRASSGQHAGERASRVAGHKGGQALIKQLRRGITCTRGTSGCRDKERAAAHTQVPEVPGSMADDGDEFFGGGADK